MTEEKKLDFNRFCNLIKEWDNIDELPDGIQNEEERWDYVFVYLGWNRRDKLCFIASMLINMAYGRKPEDRVEIYDEICETLRIVANQKTVWGEFLHRVLREQIKFVMESLVDLGFPSFILTHFNVYIRKTFNMQHSVFDSYLYNAFIKELHDIFPESEGLSEEKTISFGYIAERFMEDYEIDLKGVVSIEGPTGSGINLLFDFCKDPDKFIEKYISYIIDIPLSYKLVKKLKGDKCEEWFSESFGKLYDYIENSTNNFSELKESTAYDVMEEIAESGKCPESIKEKFLKIK